MPPTTEGPLWAESFLDVFAQFQLRLHQSVDPSQRHYAVGSFLVRSARSHYHHHYYHNRHRCHHFHWHRHHQHHHRHYHCDGPVSMIVTTASHPMLAPSPAQPHAAPPDHGPSRPARSPAGNTPPGQSDPTRWLCAHRQELPPSTHEWLYMLYQ